ncbi:MAG TPA: DUF2332 family protein [Trebonia sp.]|jgi:hypothetical protein|nr:DUF2332 family protein [Trebonia sp.]
MIGHDPERGTAENYRRFAAVEARERSPLYEEFATGVADDPELLAFLESLPRDKRQPNLLLASVRYLTGLLPGYDSFRTTVLDHREEVAAVMLARRTQTNEPARCATLLAPYLLAKRGGRCHSRHGLPGGVAGGDRPQPARCHRPRRYELAVLPGLAG